MLYRLNEVIKEVTLSKSTIYRLIKVGLFPQSIKLSPGRVAWRKSDIDALAKPHASLEKMEGV